MTIRTKIALQFSIIVATILFIFSLSIYYLSENYRQKEFYNSLRDRAITTSRLLVQEKEIDKKLLKIIDKNTLSSLYAVQVLVFNDSNQVAYSNYEADTIYYSPELLDRIRGNSYVETTISGKQVVGTMFSDSTTLDKSYVVLAQADDKYGKEKLENIKYTMIIGFVSAIILTVLFGFIFSGQSLKPISEINREISSINIQNLSRKLKTGNNKDEIAILAINFNKMLDRLEKSFELQKSFVSNASHELRTPLAALKSEIQVALEKDRDIPAYKAVLQTLLDDTQRLIKLTNGLLTLAKYENNEIEVKFMPIRIDSVLFKVQEELIQQNSEFNIIIDFEEIPDEDDWLIVNGNEQLLHTLFSNLIENACKYSENSRAEVKMYFNQANCAIRISDAGIGIPNDELEQIFQPFYRSKNAKTFKGYGIGLSICRKIVEMHSGKINIKSQIGEGSKFLVTIPHS